jgi:predicted ester cyclase
MTAMLGQLQEIHVRGGIGRIHDLFLHSGEIRTQTGRLYGRDAIAQALAAETAAFAPEDIAASLVAADAAGLGWAADIAARHGGDGLFGPATGRTVTLRSVAVYRHVAGRIVRGWRVVDTAHIAAQLGRAPGTIAAELAAQMLAAGFVGWRLGEIRPGLGQMAPPATGPVPDSMAGPRACAVALDYLWNHRRLDLLDGFYAPDAAIGWSNGRTPADAGGVRQAMLDILAAVPDATLLPEFLVGDDRAVAAVWRLIGHHTGRGFGLAPSGARVKILGASIYRFRAGRIAEERTLIDEIGVQAQIVATLRRCDLGPFAAVSSRRSSAPGRSPPSVRGRRRS